MNPFPLARFIGRDVEVADILSLVTAHGQSAAIIGEPRIGKTSLLEHLASPAALASTSDLLVSHVNAHVFDGALDAVTFWTAVFEPLEGDAVIAAAYAACQAQGFTTRSVERLLHTLAAQRQRLVVLVDEFDFLVTRHIAARGELFTGLRALVIGTHRAFSLVVASRASVGRLHDLAREQNYGGSPPFNALTEILLGPLSDAEVDQVLDAAGDRFSANDRRFLQTLTGGYPSLVQTAASELFRASDDRNAPPAHRRRTAGLGLLREASQTLTDIWRHWQPTSRYVFVAVAVEHLDALGSGVAWEPAAGLVADPATYPEEFYALERHGFIAQSPHTPSGYIVRPLVFLAWCAVKLRGHAQSAQEWSKWMDAEGWTTPRRRDLWDNTIRPRAASVRTDLDTLLAAHDALSRPTAASSRPVAAFIPSARRPVRLFFSHATADGDHVRRLEAHLSLLKRAGLLETWSSRDIGAGEEWRRRASDALEDADLIVLLVSADLLASDYLWGIELARAKERLDKGGVRLLSIRLRPADWTHFWPDAFGVLPADGRAVTEWSDADAAWTGIVSGIRRIVEEIAEVLAAPVAR